MKKWVWFGVIVGTAAFFVTGAILLIIFYSIGKAMPGAAKAAFEGVLAIIACYILTAISFKFLRLKDLILKWEGKLMQDKKGGGENGGGGESQDAAGGAGGLWSSCLGCVSDFRDALNIRHQALDQNDDGELTAKAIVLITFSAIFREVTIRSMCLYLSYCILSLFQEHGLLIMIMSII